MKYVVDLPEEVECYVKKWAEFIVSSEQDAVVDLLLKSYVDYKLKRDMLRHGMLYREDLKFRIQLNEEQAHLIKEMGFVRKMTPEELTTDIIDRWCKTEWTRSKIMLNRLDERLKENGKGRSKNKDDGDQPTTS